MKRERILLGLLAAALVYSAAHLIDRAIEAQSPPESATHSPDIASEGVGSQGRSVTVTWQQPATPPPFYVVETWDSNSIHDTLTVDGTESSATLTDIGVWATRVRVRGFDGTSFSAYVDSTFSATPPPPDPDPAPPPIEVINVGTDITLTWQAVTLDVNGNPATIDHYEVEERVGATGAVNGQRISTTGTQVYIETPDPTTTQMAVRAVNVNAIASSWALSDPFTVSPPVDPPPPPPPGVQIRVIVPAGVEVIVEEQ